MPRPITLFTGSSIWHMLYSFPPNDWEAIEAGYADLADRWNPIIDVFDAFIEEFRDRIYHVHIKDARRRLDGRRSVLGSHLNFGDSGRGWDFVSPRRGDVDFESVIRALNQIGYQGPLSIEWEDAGMSRDLGAPEALGFTRDLDFAPGDGVFDEAFSQGD